MRAFCGSYGESLADTRDDFAVGRTRAEVKVERLRQGVAEQQPFGQLHDPTARVGPAEVLDLVARGLQDDFVFLRRPGVVAHVILPVRIHDPAAGVFVAAP
jgi:hypothetical protein